MIMSKNGHGKKLAKRIWAGVRHYIAMALISLFILFPYYWMIVTAIRDPSEAMITPAKLLVQKVNFSRFVTVWQTMPLMKYMRNTFIVAIAVTLICIFIASLCGYSISRNMRSRLQRSTFIILLVTQLIPSVLPLVPLYFMFYRAKLNNTYEALIIAYMVWALPFCTLMIKNYFDAAIPDALEDSARIDGCSRFGTFFKICLPISVPGIISIAIFAFITAWNEYMWASIILSDDQLKPVSVGIYDYLGQYGGNTKMQLTMTVATIVTIPVVILFMFLQRYLISGLAAGAVKE